MASNVSFAVLFLDDFVLAFFFLVLLEEVEADLGMVPLPRGVILAV